MKDTIERTKMTTDFKEPTRTRETLLARLKDWGDQKSWCDFYDTYWRLIYAVAKKAGLSEQEAEDALQETVISIAKEIGEFNYDPKKGRFKNWLLQQTKWRIADQFRKRQRYQHRPSDVSKTELMEQVPDPASLDVSESLWDEQWHQNLWAVALERVKAQVEPRTFQIFQQHVLKEVPVAKVAKVLGVSRTQVYVAKHRVSARLDKEFKNLAKKTAQPSVEALGPSS
jgi:RNA polymerase sigma factor (sigma-70 family)